MKRWASRWLGLFAFLALGSSALAQSLTVYNEIPVTFPYTDGYMVQTFSFGLISEAAEPS